MLRRQFLASSIRLGLLGGGACLSTGCGTVFWNERSGRPHSNQIDWRVVGLDGLGLLLFFVPGVIAFVVDFCTGAIYLPLDPEMPSHGGLSPPPAGTSPPESPPAAADAPTPPLPAPPGTSAASPSATGASSALLSASRGVNLTCVRLDRRELSVARIEHVVSRHVAQPIDLGASATRVSPLENLDRFATQARRHQTNRGFGAPLCDLWRLVARRPARTGSADIS